MLDDPIEVNQTLIWRDDDPAYTEKIRILMIRDSSGHLASNGSTAAHGGRCKILSEGPTGWFWHDEGVLRLRCVRNTAPKVALSRRLTALEEFR